MRIVFFGTPDLAVPTLEAVAGLHQVSALVCQPDRPKGRGKKMEPPPTKVWAEAHGLPVHQPTKLNDGAFAEWLRAQAPDVGVLVAYGRLLKQPILDIPRHGILNLHPSLLPLYRGPSPIQSALLNGESETGVSIMRLSLAMDAGDILLQERTAIAPADDGITLSHTLANQGAAAMVKALQLLESGTAVFTPQGDAEATYCRLIRKDDGRIDWAQPAEAIHNLVRGAQPWPVAHCLFRGEVCRVHRAQRVDHPSQSAPGTVQQVEADQIIVATGLGCLGLQEIQMPGKRAMAVADYIRGKPVTIGERFESLPVGDAGE